jgi:branched-chain amino acid transport system ATP-binding protein
VTARGSLTVESAEVRYGQTQALFGISLEVRPATVVAVLGANGAGKSTLGRALSGLVPLKKGRVTLDGADITGWPAHRIRRAGLAYIPEGRGIFPGLSVLDNLKMAARQLHGKGPRQTAIDRAFQMFEVLGNRRSQRAGSLSGGEQQMLALARALCVDPTLIIADEMSLGLAPRMVDAVFESLERARDAGITVLLIEQFVHRALDLADDCVILNRGVVSWRGPAAVAGEEVLAQYLGDSAQLVPDTDDLDPDNTGVSESPPTASDRPQKSDQSQKSDRPQKEGT